MGTFQPASSHPGLNKTTAAEYSSSDSESEDERFVPGGTGEDDFGDFNPRKRRRVGGNRKEQAALGIFGSDSEDDGPGNQWKRKNLRNKGMSFVTTGVKNNSDKEDEAESDNRPVLGNGSMGTDDNDDEEDEGDESDSAAPGVGLGFHRAQRRSALDAGHATQKNTAADSKSKFASASAQTFFDGKNVLGKGFVPSSANEPVLKNAASRKESPPRNKPQPTAFGSKGKINPKSFGARMMAKMGYVEGQGLGKEGQGRNVIVEANLRPQGVGLGAVKEKTAREREEEKRQANLRGEIVVDSDDEEKKKRKKKSKKSLASAFDSAGSTPRRQKTKYLTAEELKSSAPGLHIPDAFTPILDMTGPGGKMLTSVSGIMTPASGVSESSETVEAKKLVKRAQADLLAFSEEWRSLEERKSWVELELKEREQELDELQSDMERLQLFSTLVSQELVSATGWDQTIVCLRKAAQLGSETAEVADIVISALHPYLRDSKWEPLVEPEKYAADMKELSSLLISRSINDAKAMNKWESSTDQHNGVYRSHNKATTAYESMMYKLWLPQVLASVRLWDPQEPTPMLRVMEAWNDLLPPFVRAQLVDGIVRKLESAVSDWNPKKRRQNHHLPHTWLFPWLQYLPSYHLEPKGTGLVAEVRRKFRQLIEVWEFERGIIPGLAQWEGVLEDQWRPLVMSHVLPSMGRYMRRNFRVDPADQEPYLPVLSGILKWRGMLGTTMITEVLVQDMFPMWNTKLQEWLALEEADLGEIAEWYGWWRGIVLKDYAGIERVKVELDKGLRSMNMV